MQKVVTLCLINLKSLIIKSYGKWGKTLEEERKRLHN